MPIYIRTARSITPPPSDDLSSDDEDQFLQDPEKIFDRLPQPYRFIQKIVDSVFENSWELISRIEADKEAIANRYVPPVVEASQLVQTLGRNLTHLSSSPDGTFVWVVHSTRTKLQAPGDQPTASIETALEKDQAAEPLAATDSQPADAASAISLRPSNAVTNGVLALDSRTGAAVGACEWQAELEPASIVSARLAGTEQYLLAVIDRAGTLHLLLFYHNNFYELKTYPMSSETKKLAVLKCEISPDTDFIAFSTMELNTKETAVEVYRIPKQAWTRELESARPSNLALGTLVPGFQPPPEPQAAPSGADAADLKLAAPDAGEHQETTKDISDIGPLGAGGARGSEPGAGAGGASTARSSSTSQSRETEGGATERSEKSERTARASQNSKRSSERSQSRHSQSQHSQHGGTRSQSRNHRASPSASSTAGASSSKGGADTAVGDAEEAEPEGVVDSTRPPIAAAPGAAPVEVSLQATVQRSRNSVRVLMLIVLPKPAPPLPNLGNAKRVRKYRAKQAKSTFAAPVLVTTIRPIEITSTANTAIPTDAVLRALPSHSASAISGEHNLFSQMHMERRRAAFEYLNSRVLEHLPRDYEPPTSRRPIIPTFHFLPAGRLIPGSLENSTDVKTAAGTRPSCSIGVWWSGGFQLLVYSLTPAPTTGKEHGRVQNQASAQTGLSSLLETSVPCADAVVSSAVSPCGSWLALALADGAIVVLDVLRGVRARVVHAGTRACVSTALPASTGRLAGRIAEAPAKPAAASRLGSAHLGRGHCSDVCWLRFVPGAPIWDALQQRVAPAESERLKRPAYRAGSTVGAFMLRKYGARNDKQSTEKSSSFAAPEIQEPSAVPTTPGANVCASRPKLLLGCTDGSVCLLGLETSAADGETGEARELAPISLVTPDAEAGPDYMSATNASFLYLEALPGVLVRSSKPVTGGPIQVRVHSLLAPQSRPLVQVSVPTSASPSAVDSPSPPPPAASGLEAQALRAVPPVATDACLVLDAQGKQLYALGVNESLSTIEGGEAVLQSIRVFNLRDIPELAGVVEWPPEEVSRPPPAELFEDAKPVDRLVNESLNERLGGLPERRRQLQGWWSDVREELERLGRKRPPTADNVPVIDCKSYLYE